MRNSELGDDVGGRVRSRAHEGTDAFQSTMREDLIAGVERVIGTKGDCAMSNNHIDPDFAVEVFVSAPDGAGDD